MSAKVLQFKIRPKVAPPRVKRAPLPPEVIEPSPHIRNVDFDAISRNTDYVTRAATRALSSLVARSVWRLLGDPVRLAELLDQDVADIGTLELVPGDQRRLRDACQQALAAGWVVGIQQARRESRKVVAETPQAEVEMAQRAAFHLPGQHDQQSHAGDDARNAAGTEAKDAYHGTAEEFLASIRSKGLLPSFATGRMNYGGDGLYDGERGMSVFLSQNEARAWHWAKSLAYTMNAEPVVVHVRVPVEEWQKHTKPDDVADYEEGETTGDTMFIGRRIKPEWIVGYYDYSDNGHEPNYHKFAANEFVDLYLAAVVKPAVARANFHLPGQHDQADHGNRGGGIGTTGGRSQELAGDLRWNPAAWRALSMGDRRKAWSELSKSERDELADPKTSIDERADIHLGDAEREYPNTGDAATDIKAYVEELRDVTTTVVRQKLVDYGTQVHEQLTAAGVKPAEARELALEMTRLIAAQDVEAAGRTLGDHGAHHILQDQRLALETLAQVPGFELTPDRAAALSLAVALHDSGYLTPPSGEFLDADHGRWSAQYYMEHYYDRVEAALGKDNAEFVAQAIAAHDSTVVDWDTQPELSAIALADNLALFHAEKMPPMIRYVPENMKPLIALGAGRISLDVAKNMMRRNVERSDLSPTLKLRMLAGIEEVSPVLPKFTVGMVGAKMAGVTWATDHPLFHIERHASNEALSKVLDMGQAQFRKLADTYHKDPAEFLRTGRLEARDDNGHVLFEAQIERAGRGKMAREFEAWLAFHLPGQHDQQSHGGDVGGERLPSSKRTLSIEPYDYEEAPGAVKPVEALINPSHSELLRWAGRDVESVRYLRWGDNIMFWDAYAALHTQMLEAANKAGLASESEVASKYKELERTSGKFTEGEIDVATLRRDKTQQELFSRLTFATDLRDKAAGYFEANGFRMAQNLSDGARALIQQELTRAVRTGETGSTVSSRIYRRLIERGFTDLEGVETEVDDEYVLADLLDLDDPDAVPSYLNTLVRTNVFEAMNEARFAEFTDPALEGYVVAFEYSAILDENTTDFCRTMDGRVYAADNPIWDTHRPPNHYNCRSVLIPITRLSKWDGEESEPPPVEPAMGFARCGCAMHAFETEPGHGRSLADHRHIDTGIPGEASDRARFHLPGQHEQQSHAGGDIPEGGRALDRKTRISQDISSAKHWPPGTAKTVRLNTTYPFGGDVDAVSVIKAPTQQELYRWAGDEVSSVRYSIDYEAGTFAIWNANDAIHRDVNEAIGLVTAGHLASTNSDHPEPVEDVLEMIEFQVKRAIKYEWVDREQANAVLKALRRKSFTRADFHLPGQHDQQSHAGDDGPMLKSALSNGDWRDGTAQKVIPVSVSEGEDIIELNIIRELTGRRDGDPVEVIKNPTQRELSRWAGDEVEALRWVVSYETGDLAVWNAYEAIHIQMLPVLGLRQLGYASNRDEGSSVKGIYNDIKEAIADDLRAGIIEQEQHDLVLAKLKERKDMSLRFHLPGQHDQQSHAGDDDPDLTDPDTAVVAYVAGGLLEENGLQAARDALAKSLRTFPEQAAALKARGRAELDKLAPGQDYVTAYHVSARSLKEHEAHEGLGALRSLTLDRKAALWMLKNDLDGEGWLYTVRVPKESVGVVVDYNDPNISEYAWQREIITDRPLPMAAYQSAKQYPKFSTIHFHLPGQHDQQSHAGEDARNSEGTKVSAAESKNGWGQGWWYNSDNGKLVAMAPGELGPHGDHDGWIALDEHAEELGIDPQLAKDATAPYGREDEAGRYVEPTGDDIDRGIAATTALTQLTRVRYWPDTKFYSLTGSGSAKDMLRDLPKILNGIAGLHMDATVSVVGDELESYGGIPVAAALTGNFNPRNYKRKFVRDESHRPGQFAWDPAQARWPAGTPISGEQGGGRWMEVGNKAGDKQGYWYDRSRNYETLANLTKAEGDALHAYRQNSADINRPLRRGKERVPVELESAWHTVSAAGDLLEEKRYKDVLSLMSEDDQETFGQLRQQVLDDLKEKKRLERAMEKQQGRAVKMLEEWKREFRGPRQRESEEAVAKSKLVDAAFGKAYELSEKAYRLEQRAEERTDDIIEMLDKAAEADAVKLLDSALNKASFPRNAVLFRGVRASHLPKNLRVGSTVKDAGYGSWSVDMEAARQFGGGKTVIVTGISKGDNAIALRHSGSDWNSEREVMLPRDQRYRVTAIHTVDFADQADQEDFGDHDKVKIVVVAPIKRKGR